MDADPNDEIPVGSLKMIDADDPESKLQNAT